VSHQPRPLVLASASPRRRELLSSLGLRFEVRPCDIDESVVAGEGSLGYVRRLAEEKLHAAFGLLAADADVFVLASDTTVVVDDVILGKPEDAAEGRAMLERLSGRAHEVRTAIALGRAGRTLEVRDVVTRVVFRVLGADEIARYVATGEGRDKAGGYGIQGLAGAFVRGLEGSYSNVVGLPVAETLELLVAHRAVEAWP
jgi:septum formation protein